jgi:hypothetical protein
MDSLLIFKYQFSLYISMKVAYWVSATGTPRLKRSFAKYASAPPSEVWAPTDPGLGWDVQEFGAVTVLSASGAPPSTHWARQSEKAGNPHREVGSPLREVWVSSHTPL